MTKYKKGMVVLTLFPNSDLVTAKRRPALIVQADELNTGLEQIIIAMITSNLSRDGHPSRIRINKESEDARWNLHQQRERVGRYKGRPSR
jgi:mRNA interferase MazF